MASRTKIAAAIELPVSSLRAKKRRRVKKWKAWLLKAAGSVQRADGSWTAPDLATSRVVSALLALGIIGLVVAAIGMWINRVSLLLL